MRTRALLLAALFLAPLAPLAAGGSPQPASWSPYDAISTVHDVALAAAGTTVAAALDNPGNTTAGGIIGGGTPTARVAEGDLAILDAASGFATNGSSTRFGRTHVAVSRDGAAVASLGFDATPSPDVRTPSAGNPGGGSADVAAIRLYYQRLSSGATWAPSSAATNTSILLDIGSPVGLALSDDGNRVALAYNYRGNFTVQGVSFTNGQLVTQFVYRVRGTVFDVAATSDGARVYAATQVPEGNATHGALYVIPFTFGNPTQAEYDRTANGTAFASVAVTPDGARAFAGTANGTLLVLDGATSRTMPLANETGLVSHLAVSADGRRLAAAADGTVTLLDAQPALPRALWTATPGGRVDDLALNRTGGLVLAAVNGTGVQSGAYAYAESGPDPLWRFGGSTRAVAVNEAGTLAAYAQRSFVSVVRIPREVALTHPGGVDEGPVKTVEPEGTATFELDVRNAGAGVERVVLQSAPGFDVSVSTEPAVVELKPDEVRRVNVTVRLGPYFQGAQSFNVTAVSQSSGARDETTLTVRVQARANVSIVVQGGNDRSIAAGEPVELLLGVVNNGSSDVAVGLRHVQAVSQGEPWNVTIDPTSLTLPANSVATVRATVTPPEGATNGTANAITFLLEGPDVTSEARVALRINPSLGVDLDATGRVKFVEPGKQARYNVTVTNAGSLPRSFEVFYEVTPQGGRTWAVDMRAETVRLDAGASRTIPVVVFAPDDATPNDRVSVLVTARSVPEVVNETIVSSNLTLFANAVPATPTTTTPDANPVPAPAPVLVAAALALLALLAPLRRRAR